MLTDLEKQMLSNIDSNVARMAARIDEGLEPVQSKWYPSTLWGTVSVVGVVVALVAGGTVIGAYMLS